MAGRVSRHEAAAPASAAALWLSFRYDLPTGPLIACMFGLLLCVAYAFQRALGVRAHPVLVPAAERS